MRVLSLRSLRNIFENTLIIMALSGSCLQLSGRRQNEVNIQISCTYDVTAAFHKKMQVTTTLAEWLPTYFKDKVYIDICWYWLACPARLFPNCVRSEALQGYSLPPIVSHIWVVSPCSTQEDETNLSGQFVLRPIVLARNHLVLYIDDNKIRKNKPNSL